MRSRTTVSSSRVLLALAALAQTRLDLVADLEQDTDQQGDIAAGIVDVGLQQHSRRRHLTQQFMHRAGVGPSFGIGGTALQDGLPRIGQAHHHAAHRQAIKQKFMQFRHCFPFAGADKRAVRRFSRCGAAPF